MDRGEHQAQVEEGVAVGDAILLVVEGPALGDHHLLLLLLRGVQHGRALLRLHQAVHLPVVRGAQTVGGGGGECGYSCRAITTKLSDWAAPGGLTHLGTGQ